MIEFLDPIQKENWETLNKDMQIIAKKRWVDPLQKIIDDCTDFPETRETFVSFEDGKPKFNPIAKKIGEEIHQHVRGALGPDHEEFEESSMAFMRLIYYSLKFGPSDGRVLDFCWNGIGFWES